MTREKPLTFFKTPLNILRGVTTLTRAVSGEKQNSSGNLNISQETWEIFRETRTINFGQFEIFWQWLTKIRDDILDFLQDFYLHMILLKQHLIELLPRNILKNNVSALHIYIT